MELIINITTILANIAIMFGIIKFTINGPFVLTSIFIKKFYKLSDMEKKYLSYLILTNKLNTDIKYSDDIVQYTKIKNTNYCSGLLFYIDIIKYNKINKHIFIEKNEKYKTFKINYSKKLYKCLNDYININNLTLNSINIYENEA